jgi:hypothetical protein
MGPAAQFDAVELRHEAVEDAVGDGGIADLFVPLVHGNLRSQDGRAGLITLFADLRMRHRVRYDKTQKHSPSVRPRPHSMMFSPTSALDWRTTARNAVMTSLLGSRPASPLPRD